MQDTSRLIARAILVVASAFFFITGCDIPVDIPVDIPNTNNNQNADIGNNQCLADITSFSGTGPFRVSRDSSGTVKMWVPDVPSGCTVPIVHFANGTGASCNSYADEIQHMATYGFLAICYDNPNTGQGTQAIQAVEAAVSKYPNLADATKLGFTGHSQGGGGAIMGVYRAEQKWGTARTYAGHAIEPASGFGDSPRNWANLYAQIKSPIFMFNGTADILVAASWVRQAYNALSDSIEKAWYTAVGATHIPVPTRWVNESTIPWFRWKLLGDSNACQAFKSLPNSSNWNQQQARLGACN